LCCKPDVDCECDWLSELVAVELCDAVWNGDPLSDANLFVIIDLYDESFPSGLTWYHRNADIDTGRVTEQFADLHRLA